MRDDQAVIDADGLTTEQRAMRDTARAFVNRKVVPLARELDPVKGDIPRALIDEMAGLGYFGLLIPEEYGGLGLGYMEYCLIAEQLARGWMSVASVIARGNAFYRGVGGSDRQRAARVAQMVDGQYLGALAMSEPQAGSDLTSISCRARRDGDDWVVTGNKYWCTFADGADFITVVARTSDDPGHRNFTAISFPKPRGDLPVGVSGNPIPKIGYHGWKTWELAFDGARTPLSEQVGEEGGAFYWAAQGLEGARAHTAARSIGLAQAALEDAIEYAGSRRQFGKAIKDFQAIRFKLADMATEIEATRQLLRHVCRALDSGKRCDIEAAMIKYKAAEMAEKVTSDALQIFGGAGYTTLHSVERYWRDARLTKIFEGSSEIQQRIIADGLLGKVEEV